MSCPDELTLSIYADGELAAGEIRKLEFHIASCRDCKCLLEALEGENRLLATIVEEVALSPRIIAVPTPKTTFPFGWAGLSAFLAIALVRVVLEILPGVLPAGSSAWLEPISASAQSSLLFSTLFRFVEQGSAALLGILPIVGLSVVVCGSMAGMYWAWKRNQIALVPIGSRTAGEDHEQD